MDLQTLIIQNLNAVLEANKGKYIILERVGLGWGLVQAYTNAATATADFNQLLIEGKEVDLFFPLPADYLDWLMEPTLKTHFWVGGVTHAMQHLR